jgi:hypothetical protein
MAQQFVSLPLDVFKIVLPANQSMRCRQVCSSLKKKIEARDDVSIVLTNLGCDHATAKFLSYFVMGIMAIRRNGEYFASNHWLQSLAEAMRGGLKVQRIELQDIDSAQPLALIEHYQHRSHLVLGMLALNEKNLTLSQTLATKFKIELRLSITPRSYFNRCSERFRGKMSEIADFPLRSRCPTVCDALHTLHIR